MGRCRNKGGFVKRMRNQYMRSGLVEIFMMETEVTQKLYKDVMGQNPSPISSRRGRFPVTRVKWREAATFANELSKTRRKRACYTISRRKITWANKDCNGGDYRRGRMGVCR